MGDKLRDPARRRVVTVGVLMVASGVAFVALGQAASASLGLEVVSVSTPSDHESVKQTTSSCPPGKVLLGGGWALAGAGGRATVTALVPSVVGMTATAAATGNVGRSGWALEAQAVCAGPLASDVPIVSAESVTDSSSPKSATARCPDGTLAVGAGFETIDGDGATTLTELRPAGNEVTATVHEAGVGTDGEWSVRVHGLCVPDLPGLLRASSSDQTTTPATAEVSLCPPGRVAIGAGAAFDGGGGDVVLGELEIGTLLGEEYALAIGQEAAAAAAPAWDLTTDVLCASP